jgi:nitrite reductase/ring-hydroxylating ferredoxin subunit
MVYDDGIGVGRHRHQGSPPEHTIAAAIPSTAGPEKIWVPLADATPFEEGQTLRAEVGGVVMAIAKVDGQFWAFQEFCTHRFGPLSEGSFENGMVMCPWHGSCFDVRTGKVKEGPAKVDLKTFPVQVRDGKICVDATALQKSASIAPVQEQHPHT